MRSDQIKLNEMDCPITMYPESEKIGYGLAAASRK